MDTNFKIKPFSLVVAACRKGGIGLKGGFPWPMIKKDLAHFARVTKCTNLSLDPAEIAKQLAFYQSADIFTPTSSISLINPVIMGRKTWESIP